MTIRGRLIFAFSAVLLLFIMNIGVYVWSDGRRTAMMNSVTDALDRRDLLNAIRTQLENLHKQVALLSQFTPDETTEAPRPEEMAALNQQLGTISTEITLLRKAAPAGTAADLEALSTKFLELRGSLVRYYETVGQNPTVAVYELSVRSEPLSAELVEVIAPRLLKTEQQRVDDARANLAYVTTAISRASTLIFFLSLLAAAAFALHLSSYLTGALAQLKEGALQLGSGIFSHRIFLQTSDELGELAFVFNEMSENLRSAQESLSAANEVLKQSHSQVEAEKKRSDALLQNILPASIAYELRDHGVVDPKFYEDVTIVFTDFKGFTLSTERLAAEDLVTMLHHYFSTFDEITTRYGLEKLKTIGDSYMFAGGLPVRSSSHPIDCCMAALDILDAVREQARPDLNVNWDVRIGIHTGSVVAGVVGTTKFAFDVWGDTVNLASRMESSGEPGRLNISDATYRRVKDFFNCEDRGSVRTKEGREKNMYFVNGILPSLLDPTADPAYAKFLVRYATYFEKAPAAVARCFSSAAPSLAHGASAAATSPTAD